MWVNSLRQVNDIQDKRLANYVSIATWDPETYRSEVLGIEEEEGEDDTPSRDEIVEKAERIRNMKGSGSVKDPDKNQQ